MHRIKRQHVHKRGNNTIQKSNSSRLGKEAGKALDVIGHGIIKNISPLPAEFKKFLVTNKNLKVLAISVCRRPIENLVDFFLSAASKGEFEERLKKKGHDNFFHLFMIIKLEDGKFWLVDRQARLNAIPYDPKIGPTQAQGKGQIKCIPPIPVKDGLTLGQMFEKHRAMIGGWEKMVWYDAIRNNCQTFVANHLKANNMYSDTRKAFVEQPLKQIMHGFPLTAKISNKAVALGIVFEDLGEKWNQFRSKFTDNH